MIEMVSAMPAARSRSLGEFLAKLRRLGAPYYRSAERRRAFFMLAVIVVLTLATVALSAAITYWYKGFYNALQSYDAALIWREVAAFAGLATLWVIVNVLAQYFIQVLQNRWRRWLTGTYVRRWMTRDTYYRMQITGSPVDNPDQRIAQDLEFFTAQTLQLPLGLLNSLASIVVFGVVLWQLSEPVTVFGAHVPGYLVWVNVGYALAGTLAIIWIGKPLFWLNNIYQRAQGSFRYGLARVRENSESIAIGRGHGATARQLIERFQPVFDIFHRRIRRNIGVNGFSFSFNQAAVLIPLVAVGELQRVAFVRLLVTRARWNLLDEITSNIDEELEHSLYSHLIEALPDATIISVAHRSTLRPFHQKELHLTVDGARDLRRLQPGREAASL